MRVLYFGDPRAGLGLLNSKQVKLCGVVHGRVGGEGARHFASALNLKRRDGEDISRWRLPDLSDSRVIDALRQCRPDLIVSAFYPRRITEAVLSLAPGINVHPSALPKWRGPDPSYWVIRSCETETAITIHRLSPALDEGAILEQLPVSIRPRESGGALAVRLERAAANAMVDFVQQSAVLFHENVKAWHQTLSGFEQSGSATWAPLMDPNDLEVDWSMSAEEIDAFVRAAAPDPCAFSGFGRELMVIHRGRIGSLSRTLSEEETAQVPIGQALLEDGRCFIRCLNGFYQLDEVTIGRRRLKGERLAQLLGGSPNTKR